MPITKTESTGGGGANMIVTLVPSNTLGTIVATVVGGTGPYTYVFSQAQSQPNIHQNGGMTQSQTPGMTPDTINIVPGGVIDGLGSAVMWQCVATDSLGNKAVGYCIFLINT